MFLFVYKVTSDMIKKHKLNWQMQQHPERLGRGCMKICHDKQMVSYKLYVHEIGEMVSALKFTHWEFSPSGITNCWYTVLACNRGM